MIQSGEVDYDAKKKSGQLNDLFVGKAKASASEDEVPYLAPNDLILSSLSHIITSPMEDSKVFMHLKTYSALCGISGKFVNIIATPILFSLSSFLITALI